MYFHIFQKKYPDGIVALDDFSATIPSGKLTGFIGANGSGKSTALKLLAGHLAPTSGDISFLGVNPKKEPTYIRKNIGFISQNIGLDRDITGKESLSLLASLYGLNGNKKKNAIRKVVEQYGFEKHLNKRVRSYSGGLKQRLHLALSTVHEPSCLLLDEPTNSLDSEGRVYLWKKISNHDATVIIITHDLKEATQYCDYVVLFHNGKLLAQGSPKEVIDNNRSIQLQLNYRGNISEDFQQKLQQIEGVHKVSVWKGQTVMSVQEHLYNEQDIIAFFNKEAVEILEKRTYQPDLFTAYFHLSGTVAQKVTHQNSKQSRKK